MKRFLMLVVMPVISTALVVIAVAELSGQSTSEPSTTLLFGCGMLALAEIWRKRVPKK